MYKIEKEEISMMAGKICNPEIKDFLILNSKEILQSKHTFIGQHSIHYLSLSFAKSSSSSCSVTVSQDLLLLPQFALFIPFLIEASPGV